MSRPKDKYNFTIADLALITKQPENTVRQHISRGKFNPEDFNSVIEYINTFKQTTQFSGLGYMQLLEREGREDNAKMRNENVFKKEENDG